MNRINKLNMSKMPQPRKNQPVSVQDHKTCQSNRHKIKQYVTSHKIGDKITLILTILQFLTSLTHQSCTNFQAPFPKIIGGSSDGTYITQIDFNPIAPTLIAVGMTKVQALAGDANGNTPRPIIISYCGELYNYQWGKVFIAGGGIYNDHFAGVSINREGTKGAVITSKAAPYKC